MLQMEYDPETFIEKAGDAVGIVSQRVTGDLERFKDFIESRGRETGAWRGEIRKRALNADMTAASGTGLGVAKVISFHPAAASFNHSPLS